MEANWSKALDETAATINATTAVFKAAASPTPPAPTPTRCSTNWSSLDAVPDFTVAAVVMGAYTSMASRELEVGEDVFCTTDIDVIDCPKETHTKCSTLGLGINGGTNQAVVTFLTVKVAYEIVVASAAPLDIFSPRLIADINLVRPMPTSCSVECPGHDNKVLMTNHLAVNP
ncbi:hypothetical protein E2562_020557 [Oryza meyeriana var. granulata]|uniref:Uncharacterized protein n=1 Tax=Oryza meyeriana var. granulata TaxID=110450 RepID=A0A6G1DX51_9ORYZ|nr:hypothetical protein E2562_020557 [Oryza meyeriana var. granulata]